MKIAIRNFIISFLISMVAFGLAAYVISNFVSSTIIDSFERNSEEVSNSDESENGSEPQITLPPDVIDEIKGESFNVLFIGTDYQPTRLNDYNVEDNYKDSFPEKRNRTVSADTIAVVRFSKETQTVLIATLPGDMPLMVNGIDTTLADSYGEHGLDFFINKISALTGYDLDKYFVIDTESISSIVNILGKINFYVPEDMKYEDKEQGLSIDLKRGTKLLNGNEVEQLLRYNNYTNEGNSREKTTADFMLALADKLLTDNSFLSGASAVFLKLTDSLTTNYTAAELAEDLELVSYYSDFEKVIKVYPDINSDLDLQKAIEALAAYR